MNKILAFGEIMMRLTPQEHHLIEEETTFDAYYGGTEANVLICLSHLGNKTSFLSQVPNNKLGLGVLRYLRSHHVGTEELRLKGDTLGLYFLEEGFAGRNSTVIYARKNAEVNNLKLEDLDLDQVFEGVTFFHTTGITLGISDNAKNLAIALMKEAKKRKILVSFDFNYRSKLWTKKDARLAYLEALPYIDVLFGNKFDLENFLDIKGTNEEEAVKNLFKKTQVKYLLHTIRTSLSASTNSLEGIAYENDDEMHIYHTDKATFDILDRIGSGDAFDAGVIDVLNRGGKIEEALNQGLKLGVYKHFVKGDALGVNKDQLDTFDFNDKKDVSR